MSLFKYPKYKDSRIEWLGRIPAAWSVTRVKSLFEIKKRISGEYGYDVLSITRQGIKVKDIESNDGQLSMDYSKYQFVHIGDFAMNHMDLLTGYVDISPNFGVTSPDYRVFSFKDLDVCDPRYFLYLFQNGYRQRIFYAYGQGSSQLGRWRFPTEQFNDFVFPLPPLEEQAQIAVFLDRETGKIDALIAEQEKLLALLDEKRKTIILRAITRGLNPCAPLKDSGVAWLGRVPEHWTVLPIKLLSPVRRGASPRPIEDPKYFDEAGRYAWVRIADVSSSYGVLAKTEQTLSELGASLSVKIEPGSLFVSIAGTVGKPCITTINACIHDGFVYFPELKIDPMFLFRIFEAGACYAGLGKMGTQLNLNTDTIGSIRIALPPDHEIAEILGFIANKTQKITLLQSNAERGIELLKERRSALISAAVTGKIDVRGLVEPKEAA
jgi:type I restriction enzyme S subunit